MNYKKHIGLVLPAMPGYSETFIFSKIKGLIDNKYKVLLFIGRPYDQNRKIKGVSIYPQINVKNKIDVMIRLVYILIKHPIISIKFLLLEKKSQVKISKAIKNLIINSHIIGKSLDWLHFCYATMGIGRENLAKSMKIKSAVSLRGYDIGIYPIKHLHCYKLLWKNIDRVHFISDDLYKKAVELGLDKSLGAKKITPAIDPKYFSGFQRRNIKKPLRILSVGRLHWKKGYKYALKAMRLLKKNKIDFEYHIVGDGSYMESIVFCCYKMGLNEKVIFKGKLLPEEVRSEMEWADIYLQPSIQEGFCNSVLEAQAMGLLCIVTNADGLSENVLDGVTGWVLPRRSSLSIARKIMDLLEINDNDLNLISKNAINRAKTDFTLDEQVQKFVKFYN
tara:strand:+ start:21682 stop:22854 length:1173 start_codon:yes stop_codon:yes gene_type:complete